jgi:peptide/nickel transport system permease protein
MTISRFIRKFVQNPLSVVGSVVLLAFAVVAILAPVLAPPQGERGWRNPFIIPRDGFAAEPLPPSEAHPMGTTEGQYDIYYGIIWGTRTAFQVGIICTVTTLVIGLLVGSVASYYGGWVDEVLMRIVEIFQAFPFLLAAMTMSAVLQARLGRGLLTGMIALIVFGWTGYARLIRGDILNVKQRDYVLAARAVGIKDIQILIKHILPNAIFPTAVLASMRIGDYVLSFAGLSFLGLGAEIGYADWGQMISFARNWIPSLAQYWYIVVYPGGIIVLFVLAWNLVGDAFRDILDPRLQGSR